MKMTKYGLYTAVAASMAFASQAQATMVIDDFSDPVLLGNSVNDTTAGGGGVGSTFDSGTVLGGERDIFIELLSPGFNPLSGAVLAVSGGSLTYEAGSGAIATGKIQYDGDDNDADVLDADGLGSEDLAANGNAFLLDVLDADFGFTFSIEVWSGAGGSSFKNEYVAAGTNVPVTRSFAFSDFTGVDFTDVSAIEFVINTEGLAGQTSIDFTIDAFKVPEPTSMALFGLGLMGLGYTRRRKAQAELVKA
ncbi:PEP-CTERM sorting domain-containing protein [Photobacterium japonica]|uniref:PEP-CTERM sorting domain-containing protein n=1 Tax=Photobacterium japonica TaxID=2910235 RepID=UPI003D0EF480